MHVYSVRILYHLKKAKKRHTKGTKSIEDLNISGKERKKDEKICYTDQTDAQEQSPKKKAELYIALGDTATVKKR